MRIFAKIRPRKSGEFLVIFRPRRGKPFKTIQNCRILTMPSPKIHQKFTPNSQAQISQNSPEIRNVFHTRIHQVFHTRIHQVFHTRIGCMYKVPINLLRAELVGWLAGWVEGVIWEKRTFCGRSPGCRPGPACGVGWRSLDPSRGTPCVKKAKAIAERNHNSHRILDPRSRGQFP